MPFGVVFAVRAYTHQAQRNLPKEIHRQNSEVMKQIERKRELKRRGLRRRRKRRCESWVLSGDSRANLKIKHCIFTHWQLWLFNFSHVSDDTLDSQSRRFDHYFDISKECLSHIHELSNVCYPSSFLWPKCQSSVQCSSPFTSYI